MRNCGTGLGGALGTEWRLVLRYDDAPKPDGSPGGGREEYHEEREPDSESYERTAGVVSNCVGGLSRFEFRDGDEGGAESMTRGANNHTNGLSKTSLRIS